MQAIPPAEGNAALQADEEQSALSPDALLRIARRFWPLILFAALLGGACAYYIAGRQNYTYSKSASVMLRSDKTGADSISEHILGDLGMDAGAANLANESYILKSTALMQSVVERLELNTSYWRRQQFREVDLYGQSPVLARFSGMDGSRSCELAVTPLGDTRCRLSWQGADGAPQSAEAAYGESVGLPFGSVAIHPTPRMGAEWAGETVTVRHEPALAAAQALLAALVVTRPDLKEASMLELTLSSTHPRKAEDVLNSLIEAYNQRSKDEKSEAARKTRAFIQSRLADLGRDLSRDDSLLSPAGAEPAPGGAASATAAGSSAGASGASAAAALPLQASELGRQIFELGMQAKLADALAAKLASHKDGLISLDTGISDSSFAGKIEAYNEAWLGYNRIAQSAGSKNPLVVEKLDAMAATLAAARKALDNYRSNLALKIQELEGKRKDETARLAGQAARQQELAPLIREHKVREELYMMLLAKEQENALALAVAQPSARVLESAHGSDAPTAPQTALWCAAGAGGGAALCSLALIGLGMLNNKVRDKYDAAAFCRLPALAELPELGRRERGRQGLLCQDPRSPMAECLHILRNNADSLLPRPDRGGLAIIVTSTMAGEGKTYVSANLAAAYAQAGRRVLLIDGDLRKASLTRELGGKGRSGLTSLLLNRASDPAAIIRPLPGCGPAPAAQTPSAPGPEAPESDPAARGGRADILYAGPDAPNPVTLLSQPALARLIDSLKARYDALIIDAPPCGILADTDILAAQADIALYVIRAGRVDKRYLAQVQKLADSGKLPHAALVLNAVDFKTGGGGRYGYGYGYYRYGYGRRKPAAPAD